MTQASNIADVPVSLIGDRPRGDHAGHEVKARVAAGRHSASPDESTALSRLARVLAAGEPPRTDVPRGFYLNIQV